MKIQLKDSETIIEVSSALGAELLAHGEGTRVPIDGEVLPETKPVETKTEKSTSEETKAE